MAVNNQTAIITGGASGIGLAYGEILLENGLKTLYILDVDEDLGKRVAENLNVKFGENRVFFYRQDVIDMAEYKKVLQSITKRSPKINIFINNAGVTKEELAIPVNLIGVYNGIQLALEIMGRDKGGYGGVIVSTSSILGLSYWSYGPAYTASKWGVIGLTKSYSVPRIYSTTGIKFMVICPGLTVTKLTTNIVDDDIALEDIKDQGYTIKKQRVENVANALVAALKEDLNGAVWVVENDEEPYRINLPRYNNLKA